MTTSNSSWNRLGIIGNPAGSAPWAVSHAALPAAIRSGEDGWRLYVSCRDARGRARIGRCELTLHPSPSISALDPDPVLDLGALGTFDDHGVTMSSIVEHDGATYLYYTGWSKGVTVPFYLAAGLALSTDGGRTFKRVSDAPLLDRIAGDPYLTASPFVLHDERRWRMWYVSGTRWEALPDGPRHYYHIKYAESDDGLRWRRAGTVAIDYRGPDEHAFARPCVMRDTDRYRMWYSYRGSRYRIGGAESADGMTWVRRDDEMGFAATGAGGESEMVCYPWVFDSAASRYMLYNGDDYGRTGIGLAIDTSHSPATPSAT